MCITAVGCLGGLDQWCMWPSYLVMHWQAAWTQCSPETLSHKAVGVSEKGAMPDSRSCSEGGWNLWSISMSEERTVVCHAVLMRTEVRAYQTSAQTAAQYWTAHIGEWGAVAEVSWASEVTYTVPIYCPHGNCYIWQVVPLSARWQFISSYRVLACRKKSSTWNCGQFILTHA